MLFEASNKFKTATKAVLACSVLLAASVQTALPATSCSISERTLFLRALDRIRPRMHAGRGLSQADIEKFKLRPTVAAESQFLNYQSSELFLDEHPECCQIRDPKESFGYILDRDFLARMIYGERKDKDVTSINITFTVAIKNGDVNERYAVKYDVLLGKCGEYLDLSLEDVQGSLPYKEK